MLLADQVVDMPNRMELDNNLQYEYQKYMVARGYSELWINNHYVKEKEEFFFDSNFSGIVYNNKIYKNLNVDGYL